MPAGGRWSVQRKQRHSTACKNKARLTKEQQLAIIRAVEGQPDSKPITQVGLPSPRKGALPPSVA